MYQIEKATYLNDAPWEVPFERRFRRFCDAAKLGFRTVMYLYEQADTSTFRYRAYNMRQVLRSSAVWYGEYFFSDELDRISGILDLVDVIVIIRFRWSFELDAFLKKVKRRNIPVAFDVDDMIYDTKYLPMVTNTLAVEFKTEADYSYWFSYIGRIQETARFCDAVITTNEFIGERLTKDLNVPHYIVPNFYNREQDRVSDIYYRQKQGKKSSGKFVIGYFSGTPSHINDFLTVSSELKALLDKYEDIILRVVGFMELPDYMREMEEKGRVERIPLQNFLDLQAEIAKVDVNIVPLVENEFTNCKSELKFFEASIVGTVTCAAPTFVYRKIIKDGKNGYICRRGEWYNTIKNLYENGISNEVIEEAKKDSQCEYAYYNMLPVLEKALTEVSGQKRGV